VGATTGCDNISRRADKQREQTDGWLLASGTACSSGGVSGFGWDGMMAEYMVRALSREVVVDCGEIGLLLLASWAERR
jgi:hypothetical protein